jgi:hypothetical protein
MGARLGRNPPARRRRRCALSLRRKAQGPQGQDRELRGVVYEVDATLVGETVTLRFDPSRIGKPVEIWWNGRKTGLARRVDAYANCFVKRDNDVRSNLRADKAASPPPQGLRLRDFADGHDDGGSEGGR